jgi:hypothetical protein
MFLILLIYHLMANPTWDLLQKNLTDPETIEEAVARLITAHEADPTAHLGVGESLQAHKADDILDHPQGSVLADKRSFNQLEVTTAFESSAGWTVTAYYSLFKFMSLILGTNTTTNNVAEAYLEEANGFITSDFVKNLMFQTTFSTDLHGAGDYVLEFGIDDIGGIYNTIGIKIVDNVATGYFLDGATQHTTGLGTLTRGAIYTLRIFINQVSGDVEFWLNGVKAGSITYELHYTSDEMIGFIYRVTQKRTAYQAFLFVSNLTLARDI